MKKYVLAVLVVMFVGFLVSSCGGKGFKGVKNAARDLRNSVKSQLTGKNGKTVSSGPLFGRRAVSHNARRIWGRKGSSATDLVSTYDGLVTA
jgi:hypothetical protein